MTKVIILMFIAMIIAGSTGYYFGFDIGYEKGVTENTYPEIAEKADLIVVDYPKPGDTITSPLIVRGRARGYWFFEASFPLVIVDWDGRIIAQKYAEAKDEWMTENFVPFEGTLEFANPSQNAGYSKRGAVIFQKDNPSGLPEHDDALKIPVFFE